MTAAIHTLTPPVLQQPVALPVIPQFSARETALQILSWARDKGLLAEDAYFPKDSHPEPNFGQSIDASAINTLRNRQIRFLCIDEDAKKVSIFFRKAAPTVKELKSLPLLCNGHTISYHQGNTESVSPAAVAAQTNTCALHASKAGNHYTCGSSVSVGNNREAGTLGCLVKDANGDLFGLSNNHVSGACSYAPIGLPVMAPGILDVTPGNPYPFTIGVHHTNLPMLFGDPSGVDHTQNSDAALIRITAPQLISSMQRGSYDTPTSVANLTTGMKVEKVGRTTGHTHGTIMGEIVGVIPVNYVAQQYGFSGPAYFENVFVAYGIGDVFSDGGDSGSLVTHVDANGKRHAVGIVFAGSTDSSAAGGKRSLILPLRSILTRFNVELVSGHNC
ncbi:S1 family peptidase [Comamonas sp. CMM03]|uniref:S1 family peptidase n=1 Tax=Comamonas sp. CMM03 TaxID=2854781 RepID=UPI001C495E01|nr:S1 family peptidase [Comamonas sp. CMM03]MBV7417890.1 S1 family peptidase [Comamonas sp. CMM03]